MDKENPVLPILFETAGLNQSVNFTPEEIEDLRMLMHSPGWKAYKKVLTISKQGYQQACLACEKPSRLLKLTGTVVGLNFAEVQLGLLVSQFDKQAKRVAEESKNRPQP